MAKHGFELERGRRMFIDRSLRGNAPSCVVIIVGVGAASFMEHELSALVSGGGCLSPEAARRAAVLGWSLDCHDRRLDDVTDTDAEARVPGAVEPRVDDVFGLEQEALPGRLLSDGVRLQASARYWVPPRSRVWLEGERVCMAPLGPGDDHPLDELLTSLARTWGPRSIAVLPMAPGADGERGVGALRAAGGLALQCSDEPEEVPPHSGSRLRLHPS